MSVYRVEATTLANAAPTFIDQDDDASTSYIDIARFVAESTAVGTPVGEPVSATDGDEDILFYELLDTPDLEDGDGDARFTIDSLTGPDKGRQGIGRRPRRDRGRGLDGAGRLANPAC